jgi:hypothetical protein
MNKLIWKTSSYTGSSGGNCIETASHADGVMVRDTKNRQGPTLRFTAGAWRRLVEQVKQSLPSDSRPDLGAPRQRCPLFCALGWHR